MPEIDKVIKGLEALYDSMHKNQCYACSYEFIETANEFGTEIVANALKLLEEYKRHLQNDMEKLQTELLQKEIEFNQRANWK